MFDPTTCDKVNAVVFIDFENIRRIVTMEYKVDIIHPLFFSKLKHHLSLDYRIINTIIYDNFDQETGLHKLLKPQGYDCRPSSGNGANAADIEIAVDIIRTLFKNPYIIAYIIVTSDRDIVPVLKEVKSENKTAHLISSSISFNKNTIAFADKHTYLEEIFDSFSSFQKIREVESRSDLLELARRVSELFYKSSIYKQYINHEPISLTGYVKALKNTLAYDSVTILDAFKLAGRLGLIDVYQDPKRGLCIKEGTNMSKVTDHAVKAVVI